ncbi:MAG: AbrB/MazE/SpoVT family DNA-binding domain-containing protein [Actinobacteria bacterium]|nr:AbrB/MazE/SpoVT family DNA-binding domain-containing protein [Actinomycetota bacterium]
MPRITSKGQVTIPKKIRKLFDLKTGDTVDFEIEDGKVYLVFKKENILNAISKPRVKQ